MSKEVHAVPTYCPLGCGASLSIRQIQGPCKEYMINTRTTHKMKVDWNESYGVLCSVCGYATVILGNKKD